MDLNHYQQAARSTAIYADHHRAIYPALGLASEAGEVAGKVKKVLRDQGAISRKRRSKRSRTSSATCCGTLPCSRATSGCPLDEIAAANLAKLASRRERVG